MSFFRNMADEDLEFKVGDEGFDYFFRFYVGEDSTDDPNLKALIHQYNRAADELEAYLGLGEE